MTPRSRSRSRTSTQLLALPALPASLAHLRANRNAITTLSPDLRGLANLKHLNVSSNRIQEVPEELLQAWGPIAESGAFERDDLLVVLSPLGE